MSMIGAGVGHAAAHAPGLAGDFGDRGIGRADQLAAVAGGHDHADLAVASRPRFAQQPVEERLGQRVLLDALIDRAGGQHVAAVAVQQHDLGGPRSGVDSCRNHG